MYSKTWIQKGFLVVGKSMRAGRAWCSAEHWTAWKGRAGRGKSILAWPYQSGLCLALLSQGSGFHRLWLCTLPYLWCPLPVLNLQQPVLNLQFVICRRFDMYEWKPSLRFWLCNQTWPSQYDLTRPSVTSDQIAHQSSTEHFSCPFTDPWMLQIHLSWWVLTLQTEDLDGALERRDKARDQFRRGVTPFALLQAYKTYFPFPVRSRYTVITFSPRLPILARLALKLSSQNTRVLALYSAGLCTAILASIFAFKRWYRR